MPIKPPRFDQLYAAYRAEVEAIDNTLTDWNPGSNLDALAGASSVISDETSQYALRLALTHFLDTAEGADLDALIWDRFRLTRNAATAAVGEVFWKKSGAAGTYPIPIGTEISGTYPDGTSFTALTTQSTSSDATNNQVSVQVVGTGSQTNAPAGSLTAPSGFVADPSAIVSQPSRLAGGSDRETDAQFRNRVRSYFLTLARGTVAALIQAATSVAGISFASVIETFGSGSSKVDVYVADVEGAANATLVALAQAQLDVTRAAGILVEAFEAVRQDETLTITVEVPAGIDVVTAEAAIILATLDSVNSVGSNETVYASQIAQDVHNALPAALSVASLRSGAAFVKIVPSGPQNTIRLDEANLSVVVEEVV